MINQTDLKSILFKYVSIIFLTLFIIGYSLVYINKYNYPPIRSDGEGYYSYIPSYYIYEDFSMNKLAQQRHGGSFPKWIGIYKHPETGRWINRYPIGEALMIFPFFIVGDLLTQLFHYPKDGYSFFYQHAAGLAGVFYAAAGMYILQKILSKYFSKRTTIIALIAILFGTNLYHYATYDTIFSHAYSFFLFCLFLYQVIKWYKTPDFRQSIILGFVMGLIFLVKVTNSIVWIFWLLFDITSVKNIKERLLFFKNNLRSVISVVTVTILVLLPQLLIWKK